MDLRRPDTKTSNIKGHTAIVVIRTRKALRNLESPVCISGMKSVYVASVYGRRPIDDAGHVIEQYVRLQAGREGTEV